MLLLPVLLPACLPFLSRHYGVPTYASHSAKHFRCMTPSSELKFREADRYVRIHRHKCHRENMNSLLLEDWGINSAWVSQWIFCFRSDTWVENGWSTGACQARKGEGSVRVRELAYKGWPRVRLQCVRTSCLSLCGAWWEIRLWDNLLLSVSFSPSPVPHLLLREKFKG